MTETLLQPQAPPHPQPLLRLEHVIKTYRSAAGEDFRAVDDVSLSLAPGEALGLVGESGSGKSTTGRLALRLIEPSAGRVYFEGQDIGALGSADLFRFRRQAQIVFQDPFSSLNPRMTVRQTVAEPLLIHGLVSRSGVDEEVNRLLELVGLKAEHADRYPFQFSGGQRQRISIARAIALRPRLIVADEPVSSLDVSVQAQIINLLRDLQSELGLSILFISHNLAVVRHICHRTAVMKDGRIVEQDTTEAIFERPQHEYTRLLLSSILDPDPDRYPGG